MARPKKQTADYFPHYTTSDSRTIYILQEKYGNDGYAFWFKLLETLAATNGHSFDANDLTDLEFLAAKAKISLEKTLEILDKLSDLNAIDRDLWNRHKVIWCQNFVDNLGELYSKRKVSAPKKPVFEEPEEFTTQKRQYRRVSGVRNTQSKVKESKGKESKEKETLIVDQTQHIIDAYESDIGLLSGTVKESINYYLQEGVEAELIVRSIQVAAKNNVKRFSYVEGILNNLLKEGVKTLHEYEVKEKNRNEGKRANSKEEPTTSEMRAFLEGVQK